MTDNAARLLYAGIVGDTGRFLYPSTSAHTLAVAAQLRTFNFNAADLNRELDQMPLKVAKLAGYIYQNLEIDANGAARVVLPQSILNSYDIIAFGYVPKDQSLIQLLKNIMAAAILWQVALMHVMRLKLK